MRLLVTTDPTLADFPIAIVTDQDRASLDAQLVTDPTLADATVIIVTDPSDAVEFVRWVT